MSYFAELDYELGEEQRQMEEDANYANWLNQFEEEFAIETQAWYNISIVEENGDGFNT